MLKQNKLKNIDGYRVEIFLAKKVPSLLKSIQMLTQKIIILILLDNNPCLLGFCVLGYPSIDVNLRGLEVLNWKKY